MENRGYYTVVNVKFKTGRKTFSVLISLHLTPKFNISVCPPVATKQSLLEKSAGHCNILPKALSAQELNNHGRLRFSLAMWTQMSTLGTPSGNTGF